MSDLWFGICFFVISPTLLQKFPLCVFPFFLTSILTRTFRSCRQRCWHCLSCSGCSGDAPRRPRGRRGGSCGLRWTLGRRGDAAGARLVRVCAASLQSDWAQQSVAFPSAPVKSPGGSQAGGTYPKQRVRERRDSRRMSNRAEYYSSAPTATCAIDPPPSPARISAAAALVARTLWAQPSVMFAVFQSCFSLLCVSVYRIDPGALHSRKASANPAT